MVFAKTSKALSRLNDMFRLGEVKKTYWAIVKDRVKIYRPKFGDKEFEIMGTKEVTEKFGISTTAQVIDMLGLMGDTSDNIPGCPGVGEKTASKLINEYGSIENLM